MNFDLKQTNSSLESGSESIAKLISSELSPPYNYDADNLDLIVQSMIPSQIFIMPQKINVASPN
jgi:hypothetical protein